MKDGEEARADERLRETAEKYRFLIEATSTGFVILDDRGRVLDANQEYVRMTGHDRLDELIGRPVTDWTAPYDLDRNAAEVRTCMATGSVRNLVIDYVHATGAVVPVEIDATVLSGPPAPRIMSVCRDITVRRRAEEQLRTSERLLKQSQAVAQVGHYVLDVPRGIWSSSEMLDTIFGIGPDHPRTVEGWLNIVHADMRAEMLDYFMNHVLRDRKPFDKEYRIARRSDGAERIVHGRGKLDLSPNGRPLRMFGIIQDITERRQAEARLQESEDRLSTILDNVGAAIFIKDTHYRYAYVNRKVVEIFGRAPGEIRGKGDDAFFDAASVDEIVKSDRPVIERGETVAREEKDLTAADGIPHTYWTVKLPLRDCAGRVTGLCGISTDITERRQAEKALRESEEKFAKVFRQAPLLITLSEIETGRLIDVNDRFLEVSGYARDEAIGTTVLELGWIGEEQRSRLQQALREQGRVSGMELPLRRKDGRTVVCLYHGEKITVNGQHRLLSIAEDITERMDAERRLRESEERFRSIFEHAMDGIMIADLGQRRNIEANRSICAMLGYTRDELIALSVEELHPKADLLRVMDLFEKQARGEISLAENIPMLRKDGTILEVDVNAAHVTLGGRPCLMGIFRDITERKRTDAALRERGRQLAESQRIAHIGSWEHDPRTGRVAWSDELFRLLGLDPCRDRADFSMFFGMVHPEDQPLLKAAIAKTLAERTPFSIEYRLVRRDGSVRTIHAQAELVPNEAGEPVVLSGTAQDITERKQAEERVRQSEQFTRNILDTVDEGFIVIDRDYRIVTANEAYCGQAGLPCDEVIGRHCFEISHKAARPCYEEGEDCAVRHVFATGEPHAVLHKHAGHDGQVLYVETKAFPVRDAQGRVISAIETINNITEKHLLEEERLKTQKLESIGLLAGGIAHDFNNLLQGVFGYISMAKMDADDPVTCVGALEEAEKALHLTVKLTNQLLTFSKGGKPVKRPLDVRPVIESAVKFALSGSRTDSRIVLDRDLWHAEADDGQIAQVIQNIVLNADQAMPLGGTVEISARNVTTPGEDVPRLLAAGRYVEIMVRDKGVGIPEQYLGRIFDPYFTTKEKGSGLGLATSYSIIRGHGGMIDVRSDVGKGTTFLLYLTASSAAPEEAAPAAVPAAGRCGRVLVMDDEEIVRRITTRLIEALGHEPAFAENGETAVRMYEEARAAGSPYDVVILDLTVRGGMGGRETVRKLRELDPGVKAVVSSGYSDDEVVSSYREHGFRSFLKKPYDIDALRASLGELIT